MIRHALILIGVLAFASASVPAAEATDPAPSMAKAANAFLAALPAAKREKASIPFHSEERLNWHFVPKARLGLPLKQMSPEERQAALALLKSSLSANGLKKVDTIRSLEEVLRAIEGNDRRDPELYYFTVFGDPAEKGAWGWRYEGHHASFNWTVLDGLLVASSPQFLGSNPGDVLEGPRKGTRVLAAEEDLGRALVKSLSADQSPLAVISSSPPFGASAPLGILSGKTREAAAQEDKGIAYARLTAEQQGLLLSLIQEYAAAQPVAVAQSRLARVKAELPNVKFAWMGGREKGQGHYYRIQGASFLIEYDNTQNNANHIHTVWREFKGDWGKDVLADHYRTAPHHAKHHVGEQDAKKAKPAEQASPAASQTEANKATIRRFFKAFNDGDLATLTAISDERRVFHSAPGTTPRSGTAKTLAEACPMCAALSPRNISIDYIMAEGDLVTVRSIWRGTYTGVVRDVPVSGKDVVVYYTNTYRLKDGRIVENWAAYDRLHLLEQLGFGVSPPAGKPGR